MMNASTFDTLTATKRLKEAGFGEVQAEAVIHLMRETRDTDLSTLVTKEYLDHRLALQEQRMKIWMGGMLVIAVGAITTLVKLL